MSDDTKTKKKKKKYINIKQNKKNYINNQKQNEYNIFEKKNYSERKTTQKKRNRKHNSSEKIKIYFLGGINEVGKNMTLYEFRDTMFIVDCGLAFPDQDMPGIDLVIPDFTFIERNKNKIKGIVITHGHEDHIGSLPYLLKKINIPVYGTRLTIGLIEGKLKEHNILNSCSLNVINPGEEISVGGFKIEFIHVNHSIPDSVALAIKTAAGVIIQTGDFKIDSTPIDGDMIDLARFSELGNQGVLALLSDSTNAERPGFTESERKVGDSFELLFRKAGGKRIIVATFASNIHRVQQIINVAERLGRKVVLSGRSLENVVSISQELGYLHIPENTLIDIDSINNYKPEDLVLITTGSQGEPMSALTRMAFAEHRSVSITSDDYVIISANPIPGNEKMVGNVINELMRLGAEVVYEKMYDVHVSGHACQEELKIILGIVKPKYFIPVHGEQKHLQKHSSLAENVGIEPKNIMIVENGACVEVSDKLLRRLGNVPAGDIMVDGYGVGDVEEVVLKDRKHLSTDGLIVVVAVIDAVSGDIISSPTLISRGFIYVKENEDLIKDAEALAYKILNRFSKKCNTNALKGKLKDALSSYMFEKIKRKPMILPIVMEV